MMDEKGIARRRWWAALAGIGIVAICVSTAWGRSAGRQFFASLRIAKPKPVGAVVSAAPGSTGNRQLQSVIGSMLSDSVQTTIDEPDQPAPTAMAAAQLAGFAVQLPRARTDAPTVTVTGARAISLTVHRAQLRTILAEAGEIHVDAPPAIDGASVTIRTPRAIRVQFGHCPATVANTLQTQLQGPPVPTADNSDCILLAESPPVAADLPAGLDMEQVVGIGLELSGLSPDQRQAFQKLFAWRFALSLAPPRSVRSSQGVVVNGAPGVLYTTGSRRGPTYALIWTRNDLVYVLTGYGSSGDAVALATSTN